MTKHSINHSQIIIFALLVFLNFESNANSQETCPPESHKELQEIQQALTKMTQKIGAKSYSQKRMQLYETILQLPPICLRGSSIGEYQNPYFGNSSNSIYQNGATSSASGIPGCDGFGCTPF